MVTAMTNLVNFNLGTPRDTDDIELSMLWALRQAVSTLKVVESCKMLEGFVQNLAYSRTRN